MSTVVIIKANCPRCGDISLGPSDIELALDPPGSSSLRFVCPGCGDELCKPVPERVIEVLLAAGVQPAAELSFEDELHAHLDEADPISTDELIAFHELLRTTCGMCALEGRAHTCGRVDFATDD